MSDNIIKGAFTPKVDTNDLQTLFCNILTHSATLSDCYTNEGTGVEDDLDSLTTSEKSAFVAYHSQVLNFMVCLTELSKGKPVGTEIGSFTLPIQLFSDEAMDYYSLADVSFCYNSVLAIAVNTLGLTCTLTVEPMLGVDGCANLTMRFTC